MLILLAVGFIQPVNAKVIKKVAQTGLQFLKVDMSARSAAMGGAFTMAGHGADAIFHNPASMTQTDAKYDLFATRTEWIADLSYNAGALAINMGNFGSIGLHFISADYGQIIGTMVDPQSSKGFKETGSLSAGGYAVGVSYARALTNKFTVGGTVKYAAEQLGSNVLDVGGERIDNKVSGLAYDFGSEFYPGFKSFRLGMSIRNFSPQYKYEDTAFELPMTFRIGFAMDLFDLVGGSSTQSLLLDIDALHPRDYTERVHIGAEYLFHDLLAIRAGYKTNYDVESLSLGFGLKYAVGGVKLKLDYAYSPMDVFNNVQRITIGGSF